MLLVVALAALVAGCGGSDDGGSSTTGGTSTSAVSLGPAFGSMLSLPGVLNGPPPWPANAAQLQLRLREIGLDPLTKEGQVLHIHQHLDIFVEGKAVTVPANVGIDASGKFIAALHTHDTDGILHVESPTASSYSLGQFFAVWGLRLDRNCIGGLCATGDKRLAAWVDGKPVDADPTRIVLGEHQVIVLAYGTPAQDPQPVPATHDFEADGV
ncbi:MAG TPA: hypothetical protein VMY78_12760 [Solirubrobacteraceae bacterium]|nr:hypothetical protein [Solirubrobacteraceae bacterium]